MEEVRPAETAKEVAGKSIGRFGLFYITLIVLIGVGSSYFLSDSAITAVMTMIGGALVAEIQSQATPQVPVPEVKDEPVQ